MILRPENIRKKKKGRILLSRASKKPTSLIADEPKPVRVGGGIRRSCRCRRDNHNSGLDNNGGRNTETVHYWIFILR